MMDISEQNITEQRKEKFLNWFKEPHNLALFLILVATSIFRFYFLFKTKAQALWYDEGLYLMLGKNAAGVGDPTFVAIQRDYFVSLIWSLFIRLGIGEFGLRILTVSAGIASLLFFYLLVEHFFGKKIGLIALVLAAAFYEPIFWSLRLDIGTYSVLFILASLTFFAKGLKNKKLSFFLAAAALAVFGLLAHAPGILIILFYIVFVPIYTKFRFYKSKKFWISLLFLSLLISPFIINNLITVGEIYPRYQSGWFERDAQVRPISEAMIYITSIPNVIGMYTFIFFLIGLIISLDFVLGIDQLLKRRPTKQEAKKIFILLYGSISLTLGIQSLIVNGGGYYEPRYVIAFYLSTFVFAAIGIDFVSLHIKKYSKPLSILFILGLLIFISHANLNQAADLINFKKDSYQGIKQAGLWLKANADPSETIISFERAQIIYYSGINVVSIGSSKNIGNQILEEDANYLLVWMGGGQQKISELTAFAMSNNNTIIPMAAFPPNQPSVVIYKIADDFKSNSG